MKIDTDRDIRISLLNQQSPFDQHNTMVIGETRDEDYDGECYNLGWALKQIADFIGSAYTMNCNPLAHLRKHFSSFDWVLADVSKEAIMDADYVWRSGIIGKVVIARDKKGYGRRRICYSDSSLIFEWIPVFLEDTGAFVVIPTDDYKDDACVMGVKLGKFMELTQEEVHKALYDRGIKVFGYEAQTT